MWKWQECKSAVSTKHEREFLATIREKNVLRNQIKPVNPFWTRKRIINTNKLKKVYICILKLNWNKRKSITKQEWLKTEHPEKN